MFDATSPTNYIIIRAPEYAVSLCNRAPTKYSTALSQVNWDLLVYWRWMLYVGLR